MQELYNEVVKIINQLIRSCEDASEHCQIWTYDGHKRMYQTYSLDFYGDLQYLKKKVFDVYRFRPKDDKITIAYQPNSYKSHFPQWEEFIKSSIESLGDLNKRIFNTDGVPNEAIETLECIIKCLVKNYERTCREIKQYTDGGWNPILLQEIDRKFHKKFKKIMNKKGYK